ncbi:MAG: DEAD/DEAH box helicase [Spirochaetaceae bacterium]|nr:DEAD/DEAH box helicase [Spirochaetaceae bacterium]
MQIENPLIVQSDRTLLLDVHAPRAEECRAALIPFAELERSPEHLHTYRLTPLSLWNASSAGFSPEDAVNVLKDFARYDVPQVVLAWITETASRFGKIRMIADSDYCSTIKENSVASKTEDSINQSQDTMETLFLVTDSFIIFKMLQSTPSLNKFIFPIPELLLKEKKLPPLTENEKNFAFGLKLADRGNIKYELLKLGWPVKDEVPMLPGEPLELSLKPHTLSGQTFSIRSYQKNAAEALVGNKGPGTGFGTIVLPCGAGKTIVGMLIMNMLQTNTLIVTTNISAVHQWISELLDKTSLLPEDIAEYTGEEKDIKPVTVATYQVLTWRPNKDANFPHFQLFRKRSWGLIIYDEVHLLPAPVFRVVAELQAIRRVGLTATLVREDGCEGHVFSLVGPKRYDVPWKDLEKTGWIASAECIELRIDFPSTEEDILYTTATQRQKHRRASENPAKTSIVLELVKRFPEDKIIVIGQYLEQLKVLATVLNAPIITGSTPTSERDLLYGRFRSGEINILVVSKVANFAIDLPDASMAIQVSGTFGSRQEEAQRLGRILRPKDRISRFFTLITRNTVEEDFGSNRQKFLAEQGYSYKIIRYNSPSDLDEITQALPCNIQGGK